MGATDVRRKSTTLSSVVRVPKDASMGVAKMPIRKRPLHSAVAAAASMQVPVPQIPAPLPHAAPAPVVPVLPVPTVFSESAPAHSAAMMTVATTAAEPSSSSTVTPMSCVATQPEIVVAAATTMAEATTAFPAVVAVHAPEPLMFAVAPVAPLALASAPMNLVQTSACSAYPSITLPAMPGSPDAAAAAVIAGVAGAATAEVTGVACSNTLPDTRPRKESLHKRVNRWLLPGEQLYTRSRLFELIRCIRKLAKLMGFEFDNGMLLPTVMYLDRFVASYGRINSTTCYRLFLVSAVVTLKFWGEERYGIDFKLCSYVSGIPVQEIAQLERLFLGTSGLQYNLFLRPEELDTYTQQINLPSP